jgi:hypothetical protein
MEEDTAAADADDDVERSQCFRVGCYGNRNKCVLPTYVV